MDKIDTIVQLTRLKILGMSIQELITKNQNIELELLDDIQNLLEYCFQSNGIHKNGRFWQNNNDFLTDSIGILKSSRTVELIIRSINQKSQQKFQIIEINNFGFIRQFIIKFPKDIEPTIIKILPQIEMLINEVYNAIKVSFILNAQNVSKEIFGKLYAQLKLQFLKNNKVLFLDHCKFFLFADKLGLCILDEESTRSAIKYYTTNQDETYSPFEMMTWLFSETIPFEKSVTKEAIQEGKGISRSWIDAKYVAESVKAFISYSNLFNFEDYITFPVGSHRNYVLSIFFQKKYEKEISPELELCKGLLFEEFKIGIKNYSAFIKFVKLVKREIPNSASFIGKILGEITSTVINNMGYG